MISSIHRQWLNQRILIADQIISTFGKNAEADANILLCCVLSALAATVWPGDGIDRKRFIQLLSEFSPLSASVKRISICALIRQFEDVHQQKIMYKLINHFFHSQFAYLGKSPEEYGHQGSGLYASTLPQKINPDDVDADEETIFRVTPEISPKFVRRASYASIIYSDLRSGLVHEYEVGKNVAASGWHHDNSRLNYVNFLIMPGQNEVESISKKYGIALDEARDALSKTHRRLYFRYAYMRELVTETANSVFAFWDTIDNFDRPNPTCWWIDGKI